MELKEIGTLLYVETGAPSATVLSNEYNLYLLFYYRKEIIESVIVEMPRQRDNKQDRGVAVVEFSHCLVYKFGYPNVEVLQAHPYYLLGFRPYKLFEVLGSDWVDDIEKRNRIHPRHNAARYKAYRHFLVAFEDSTFECIAAGLEIDFRPKLTMVQTMEVIVSKMC